MEMTIMPEVEIGRNVEGIGRMRRENGRNGLRNSRNDLIAYQRTRYFFL